MFSAKTLPWPTLQLLYLHVMEIWAFLFFNQGMQNIQWEYQGTSTATSILMLLCFGKGKHEVSKHKHTTYIPSSSLQEAVPWVPQQEKAALEVSKGEGDKTGFKNKYLKVWIGNKPHDFNHLFKVWYIKQKNTFFSFLHLSATPMQV